MLAKIIVHPDLTTREQLIQKLLEDNGFFLTHPDLLYLSDEEKLGVESAKKIREHLLLKPFQGQGRGVVLVSSHKLTPEAQNALLKTLEEPPEEAVILLGTSSEELLLPTVLSRCQIQTQAVSSPKRAEKELEEVESLIAADISTRLQKIEKTEDKDQLFGKLLSYFQLKLREDPSCLPFSKELLQAQLWSQANVNTRAILEYLMLIMPRKG